MEYKLHDRVMALMPDGWLAGRITRVIQNYGFYPDLYTAYEIEGDKSHPYVTIASAKSIRVAPGSAENEKMRR